MNAEWKKGLYQQKFTIIVIFVLESVKGSGLVSKCKPPGEFSLENVKMIFSTVHMQFGQQHQALPAILEFAEVQLSTPREATYKCKLLYREPLQPLQPLLEHSLWDTLTHRYISSRHFHSGNRDFAKKLPDL